MPESALDELVAKQEITDVLHRYCRGIDRRDWELVRSCYHDDAYDDHALYRGERDGLIEFFKDFLISNCSATRHSLSNVLITVDGDTAGAESYVHAWHRMLPEREDADTPPKDMIMGARYVDRLERRDGQWRLANRLVVSDWIRVETNEGESFDLGPDALWSRTDQDDASYSVLPSGDLSLQ